MKKSISFSYVSGDSLIHRLDPRSKLFTLITLSVVIFRISLVQDLIYPVLLFLLAAFFSGTPLKKHLISVKPIAPFLVAIFAFHFLLTPGQYITNFYWFSVSREGIVEGFLVVGRFILLILFASLFSSTTSPAMLVQGMESILRPFPIKYLGLTASEIATMIALSLNLIPMLLRYMGEIRDAQLSRGLGNKFALAGILSIALPFFSGCLRLADDISIGMESRCYHGGLRTQLYEMKYESIDYVLTIATITMLVISGFYL